MNSNKNLKSYVTNSYILNINEVYKGCKPPHNQYVSRQPEPSIPYARNCEPKINYPCPLPNNIKCWDEPSVDQRNDLVRSNIKHGGVICEFKPRTHINIKISSRFLNDFVRPPCDYVKDVETEFYLIHGENSSCSSRYWKDRHRH
jgi:hypothetical protein